MNAALSTFTAATTRALLWGGAQACTAANDGTMKRPPAAARAKRSKANRRPDAVARSSPGVISAAPGTNPEVTQARSRLNSPIRTAPIGTKARFGRRWLALAAATDPAAIPSVKRTSPKVTTCGVPPICSLVSVGNRESATTPTSQNQETIRPPIHRRGSALRSRSRLAVALMGLSEILISDVLPVRGTAWAETSASAAIPSTMAATSPALP